MCIHLRPPNNWIIFLVKMSVSRRELFLVWHAEADPSKRNLAVDAYVFADVINRANYNNDKCIQISTQIKTFSSKLATRWRKSHYNNDQFEKKNKMWLDGELVLVDLISNAGRPIMNFSDCQESAKKKRVYDIVKEIPCEELMSAASTSLYRAGKRNASTVVSSMASDEEMPKRIKTFIQSDDNKPIKYTAEEALALYIDGGYTKRVYMDLVCGTKQRNANIFPSYDVLRSAKKLCYPNGLQVSDHSFEVTLQSLVDHTVARLFTAHRQELQITDSNKAAEITAIYKWGCDGSSGHATYRQSFDNIDACMIDQYMFAVCLVPLQIVFGSTVVWQNTKPSTTRYCRPLKLLCQKETAELVISEVQNVESQIAQIQPTSFENFTVRHQFHMTMIDGKVFSVVANSSSQKCGICGTSPKNMNDLETIKNLPCKENLYEYGLSTLHAWIRFFECILHIAYRIPIKKWQVRSTDKEIVDEKKKEIQEKLRQEMSILVDIPLPGSGTTNNGNTARKFFNRPELAAHITGVSFSLIHRFGVILRTLASGFEINTDAFHLYTYATATVFVGMYPWFYMPASVHKILMHGADIIRHVALPIGKFYDDFLIA